MLKASLCLGQVQYPSRERHKRVADEVTPDIEEIELEDEDDLEEWEDDQCFDCGECGDDCLCDDEEEDDEEEI